MTQTFGAVFSPGVVEAAMASDSAEKFAAIVAADRADVRVYDGDIAHPVQFHDGKACLIVRNEANVSVGLIEIDDETVIEWARTQFERHQAEATPLTPERLAAVEADAPAEA